MLAYSPRSSIAPTTIPIPAASSAAASDDDDRVPSPQPLPPGIFVGQQYTPSATGTVTQSSATYSNLGYVNGGFAPPSVSPTRLPTDAGSSTTTLTSLPAYSASCETETSSVSTRLPDERSGVVIPPASVDDRGGIERDDAVPPSTHHRDHHRRHQRRSRQRSTGGVESDAAERGAGCSNCCRYKGCSVCCARCVFIATSVKFMLVSLAIFGTGSVVVGIGLGALNMVVGNNFLTMSLIFIGNAIIIIIIIIILTIMA